MDHPGIAELLDLRDGVEGSTEVEGHVAECAGCSTELARLRALREGLRALPPVPPGPELWARVVAAVEPPVTLAARRSRLQLGVAAVAAALALALGLGVLSTPTTPTAATGGELASNPAAVQGQPSIDDLQARSQRLEAVLAALESSPRVTTARSAGTIAELQDGIALVDYQLGQVGSGQDHLRRALWKKRVDLMESLVTIRYSGERTDSI